MGKKPSQKPIKAQNEPAKIYSAEDVSRTLAKFQIECAPSHVLEQTAKLWNEFEQMDDAQQRKNIDKLNKQFETAASVHALDHHFFLAETVHKEKYRTLVIEVANQLVAEYECKTTSEKMLAETAAWAYCRMLEYSVRLNSIVRQEYITTEKNNHYALLSKEVDRCVRQYLSALNTLKHFKQPPIKVTFKANNAFVAQNQQINTPKEQNNAGQ